MKQLEYKQADVVDRLLFPVQKATLPRLSIQLFMCLMATIKATEQSFRFIF